MKTLKALRFGQLIYKLSYDDFNHTFESFICVYDNSLNEYFVGSLGAYTNSDWNGQIRSIDDFIIRCYKKKAKDYFGRKNRLQLVDDVSMGKSSFDNCIKAIKKMISLHDINTVKELTQNDVHDFMLMNDNWLGFDVGKLHFHLNSRKDGRYSLHYINTLTEQNDLKNDLKSIESVNKNIVKMVDKEIEKLYNELELLKEAKKQVSNIIKNTG